MNADMTAMLAQARRHVERGEIASAEPLYRAVVCSNPHNTEALQFLARFCRYVKADAAQAETLLRQVLAADQSQPQPYLELAELCSTRGDRTEALSLVRAAYELAPNDPEVLCAFAECCIDARDYIAALAYYRRAGELFSMSTLPQADARRTAVSARIRQLNLSIRDFAAALACERSDVHDQFEFLERTAPSALPLDMQHDMRTALEMEPDKYVNPMLLRLENARVITDGWIPVTADCRVIIDGMTHNPDTFVQKSEYFSTHSIAKPGSPQVFMCRKPPLSHRVDAEMVLIGGYNMYYHWLIDYLPRLMIVHALERLREMPLIVPDKLTEFQRASMDMIGIDPARLVSYAGAQVIAVRTLWVPTMLAYRSYVHRAALQWLRQHALRWASPDQHPTPPRLFASRQDADKRILINEDEVYDALRPLGFVRVRCSALSLRDQIRYFANAECIVGGTGSNLTSVIFSNDYAAVVELFPAESNAFIRNICALKKQPYAALLGTNIVDATKPLHHWDFMLSATEVRDKVSALLTR